MSLLNQILQHIGTYAIKSRGTSNGWNYTLYQDKRIEATKQIGVAPNTTSTSANLPFTMADTTFNAEITPTYNWDKNTYFGVSAKGYTYVTVACTKTVAGNTHNFDVKICGYIA